jgi:hypothetical protein
MHRMIRPILLVLALCAVFCAALRLAAQEDFPLQLWAEHKQVTQIPWTVNVGKPAWRTDFRQEISITAWVRPHDLNKSGDAHDLVFFARVREGGNVLGDVHSVTSPDEPQLPGFALSVRPSVQRGGFLQMIAIARPGKYRLELALLDRATGRYSTRYEDVTVPAANDAVEQALQTFPKFEFVHAAPPEQRELWESAALSIPRSPADMIRQTQVPRLGGYDTGGTTMPGPSFVIDKPRVTHLSVISVLSPPENAVHASYLVDLFEKNLAHLLHVFTRLDVTHGTAKLTGIDLADRRTVFDKANLKDVARDQLKNAIDVDRSSISLESLTGRVSNGQVVRDLLREPLQQAENDSSGADHVILVVGARRTFPGGVNLTPLQPKQNCHCRVFYVRFALVPNEADDVERLLKPYKPQVFEPLSWMEFRKDFAEIYAQLQK